MYVYGFKIILWPWERVGKVYFWEKSISYVAEGQKGPKMGVFLHFLAFFRNLPFSPWRLPREGRQICFVPEKLYLISLYYGMHSHLTCAGRKHMVSE